MSNQFYNEQLAIKYAYATIPHMGEYFDMNSMLLNNLKVAQLQNILESPAKVKQAMQTLYQELMKNRIIHDYVGTDKRLSDFYIQFLRGIRVVSLNDSILVSFPLTGKFNITLKGYRNTVIEQYNIQVTPYTQFKLRNTMLAYGNEKYSLAFHNETMGFAIIVAPSGPSKGHSSMRCTFFTKDAYVIDDASKYIDVTPFVEGIS